MSFSPTVVTSGCEEFAVVRGVVRSTTTMTGGGVLGGHVHRLHQRIRLLERASVSLCCLRGLGKFQGSPKRQVTQVSF